MLTDYVTGGLSTTYSRSVGIAWLPRNALPEEDWEVREALEKYQHALHYWKSCSRFSALCHTRTFRDAKRLYERQYDELKAVVSRSAIHRSALYRVINDVPSDNDGHGVLAKLLKG